MKVDPLFLANGHKIIPVELPEIVRSFVKNENWNELDHFIKIETRPEGLIGAIISQYIDHFEIEHIIALRKAPDEDGIWHDDGSRDLAFSLSLNPRPNEIIGGRLLLRNKGMPERIIPLQTQPWGHLILFLTGKQQFEHMTEAVQSGQRLVAAGWVTEKSS
ncbi:MAG: hypothetical protein Fur0010_16150 [Bdellovibrio sp.]